MSNVAESRGDEGELYGSENTRENLHVSPASSVVVPRPVELRTLFDFTDRLFRAEASEDAYEAALSAIVDGLSCQRASILLFDEAGVMRFVASRALSANYRAAVDGHSPWRRGEREAKPILAPNIGALDTDPETKAIIAGEGIAALAFIPLVADGGVIGKFMAYYDAPHGFLPGEVDLALTIARQLAFSIEHRRASASLAASEERHRAVLDSLTEMVCRFTADGEIQFVNRAYADARGTTPQALHRANLWDFVSESDRPHVRAMLDQLTPQAPEVRIENRFLTTAGERWMLWTNRVLRFDAQGRWLETQSTGIDISERKAAEQTQQRLISIVENSSDAIISKDLNGIIRSWNKGAERLFGYQPDEIIGRPVLTLIPPELHHEEPDIIRRISRGERIEHFETVRVRKTGERVQISLSISPVKDAEGRITGASKIARDITERKRAEEQRTLLINELNHRVKNTLATVQSLAMQTLRNTERSEDARALFESRLTALSRAHDLLTAENWEGASLAEVVHRALTPFDAGGNRIRMQGSYVRLTPRQALALSIALHELATNAAKYGALSGDWGYVDVRWSSADGMLRLTWTESEGPPVEQPTRAGFGSRLIQRSLAAELGGSAIIEYRRDGLYAEINAPVEAHKRVGQ